MIKALMILCVFVTMAFSGTVIKTKYRTDLDVTTGKALTQEYVSTFEIQDGRFIHSAPGITSVYVTIQTVNDFKIGSTTITAVPCRSEALNEYLYLFDLGNSRIYALTSNGAYLVQFDIESVTQ